MSFEKFTDKARKVLVLAQDEARKLHQPYVGTEHLLLGLVNESDCHAMMALSTMGVSADAVRNVVDELVSSDHQERGRQTSGNTDVRNAGPAFGQAAFAGMHGQGSHDSETTLERFGRNLTKLAHEGKLDPVIGRTEEIRRTIFSGQYERVSSYFHGLDIRSSGLPEGQEPAARPELRTSQVPVLQQEP